MALTLAETPCNFLASAAAVDGGCLGRASGDLVGDGALGVGSVALCPATLDWRALAGRCVMSGSQLDCSGGEAARIVLSSDSEVCAIHSSIAANESFKSNPSARLT